LRPARGVAPVPVRAHDAGAGIDAGAERAAHRRRARDAQARRNDAEARGRVAQEGDRAPAAVAIWNARAIDAHLTDRARDPQARVRARAAPAGLAGRARRPSARVHARAGSAELAHGAGHGRAARRNAEAVLADVA